MPKMPDLQSFESPVRVQGERGVGSYDLSPLARGNAALQAGVETLGRGVQAVGADIKAVSDSDQQYQYAIAKASFNIDHTNIQADLQHDQDYPTLQPRYTEQAQAAQSRWADTLTNPSLRARFNAETGQSIASGNATMKERAWTLEGNTKLADIDDRGKSLSDGVIADPMNEGKFGANLQSYGDMVDSMVAKGWLTPTQAAQKKDAWAHSAGVGVGLARADIDPVGALNEVRAMPGTPEQIDNRIMHVEGPGKDSRSSAVGGFVDQTWLDLMRKNRPDLVQGKSDADILALRADAGLRADMTKANREANTQYLRGQGLEATPGNIYLSHFLGPGAAAAVLKADPNKPVADVLLDVYKGDARKVQEIVDANPKVLGGQLAGSVVGWANGKMGGAIPGGGHIYDWLDDNQRRQIASYAQNKIDANQLDQQSTLKQRIEDTAAEAARTGYASNPVTQSEFVASRGLVEGPKAYAQYQAGLKTAADISNVARMSADQQAELVKSYEPQPGEGYAAAAERQDAIRKAIAQVHKERDADPATFAINRVPAVKAAFDNFEQVQRDPTAQPGAKQLAARDYINKTTERQIASGVAPSDVRIVPAGYVDNLNKAFTTVATSDDPQARQGLIGRVNAEKQLWGDVWPKVMGQLPPETQPVVRAIAAGANPVAMSRLLALPPKENPVAILKEQNEVTARNMTGAVNSAMAGWQTTLVGPQSEAYFNGYNGLVQRLAALYVRDGNTSAETAAANAFNAVIGDRYDFRDTWRAPKDPQAHIDPDAVQRGTLAARDELVKAKPGDASSPFGSLRLQVNDMGVSDNEADSRRNYARNGVFVTSPNEDGLNIAYGTKSNPGFVTDKEGKRILLTWDQLAKMGGTPQAAAADIAHAVAGSAQTP